MNDGKQGILERELAPGLAEPLDVRPISSLGYFLVCKISYFVELGSPVL